jgi:hypothetical protein
MHYIIGTQIRLSSSPRGNTRTGYKRKVTSDKFKTDVTYTLYHIRQDDEGKIRYVFVSNDQQDVVGLVFDSPSLADKEIARLRGEDLPNYEEVYSRNTS